MFKYKLIVGVPLEIEPSNIDQLATITDEYTLVDNHITFNIIRDNSSAANSGTITIFNAPRAFANIITQHQGQRPIIQFKAGFDTDPELPEIFRGIVETATETNNGINYELKLKLSDGGSNRREFTSKRTYPKETSIDAILRDLIGDAGLAQGPIYAINETIKAPMSISGSAFETIQRISEKYGMNFSVQSNAASIVPGNAGTQARVTRITPETGMVGSPSLGSDPAALSKDNTTPKQGIKVTSLLNGNIIPENFIEVVSENVNGVYKVEKVVHQGSYEGGQWFSNITAKPTDFNISNYVIKTPYRS